MMILLYDTDKIAVSDMQEIHNAVCKAVPEEEKVISLPKDISILSGTDITFLEYLRNEIDKEIANQKNQNECSLS